MIHYLGELFIELLAGLGKLAFLRSVSLLNLLQLAFQLLLLKQTHTSSDVTKFKFKFDDIRILATSGVFDIPQIVWSFSVECEQSKNFPFIAQKGNWCTCAQLVLGCSFQMLLLLQLRLWLLLLQLQLLLLLLQQLLQLLLQWLTWCIVSELTCRFNTVILFSLMTVRTSGTTASLKMSLIR